MPYALVPDGFSLKKVTKDQKEAVDSYTNAESIQAFFDGPASGELVKGVVIVVTPIILAVLAKRGYEFAEEEVKDILTATGDLGEGLITSTANVILELYKGSRPYST